MTGPPRTLAIVGGGPRAVYALEALARRAGDPRLPHRVDVYEPRSQLGTGMAYLLDQPDWISLNIPDHALHAGRVCTGDTIAASSLVGPFASSPHAGARAAPAAHEQDAGVPAPDTQPDSYPPRAAAGGYLTALADRAVAALAPTTVRHLRRRVRRVERAGSELRVHTADGASDYDAVLLVTGHTDVWPGLDLPADVPAVRAFPVADLVATAARLRPATVQIRGAHLSAIDATLALSEGLGGHFTAGAHPTDPDRLRYQPGEIAPLLTLASRTGRLMHAKTDAAVLRRYRSEKVAAPFLPEVRTTAELAFLLERIAAAILTQARRTWDPGCAVIGAEQIRPVWDTLTGPVADDPLAALRRSLAHARGRVAPDATWALGQAWRHAYPNLVERQRLMAERTVRGGTAPPLDWPDYTRLVTGLDRLAFGPPPGNVAKLLALAEAGRLLPVRTSDLPDQSPDLVVDAVTAPPGLPRGDELWDSLLADGLVRLGPTGRSVVTDPAGACLAADGSHNGLAAVGRMTEDHVIGTDTLLRSMHPELELWADRLLTPPHP